MTFGKTKTCLIIKHHKFSDAFTLIEAMTVLVIVAMISVAAINVHARIKKTTESIESRLDSNMLTTEVLQRIAEDLDRLAAPGLDTII